MPRRKVDLDEFDAELQPFDGHGLRGLIGDTSARIVPGDEMMLSPSEADELTRCEIIIERGLQTFFEVGVALAKVRDFRLYRTQYRTFEAYCSDRWGISRPQAYRLMDAAQVQVNLSPIGDKFPINEAQARPLTKLPDPALQREAWQRAITTAPDGRITAAHVEQVVKQFLREAALTPAPAPSSPPNVIDVRPMDAGEPTVPVDLQAQNVELKQRLADVQAILAAYQAQIAHAQGYPPTSEQGTAVAPLLQALEQVQAIVAAQRR